MSRSDNYLKTDGKRPEYIAREMIQELKDPGTKLKQQHIVLFVNFNLGFELKKNHLKLQRNQKIVTNPNKPVQAGSA